MYHWLGGEWTGLSFCGVVCLISSRWHSSCCSASAGPFYTQIAVLVGSLVTHHGDNRQWTGMVSAALAQESTPLRPLRWLSTRGGLRHGQAAQRSQKIYPITLPTSISVFNVSLLEKNGAALCCQLPAPWCTWSPCDSRQWTMSSKLHFCCAFLTWLWSAPSTGISQQWMHDQLTTSLAQSGVLPPGVPQHTQGKLTRKSPCLGWRS